MSDEKSVVFVIDDDQSIRDALRSYAQERLAPNAARWDKEHHFPQDELRELAGLGAFGIGIGDADSERTSRVAGAEVPSGRVAGDGWTNAAGEEPTRDAGVRPREVNAYAPTGTR